MRRFWIATVWLLLPVLVHARSYDVAQLPYSDPPRDLSTAIAVSVLTEEGILGGYPDGTIRPDRLLNRAEFLKIVMGLVPADGGDYSVSCFVDVPSGVWYTEPVCRAKAMGIVSGNALPDVSIEYWPFYPDREVQYEEAVKMLVELFELPLPDIEAQQWYEPYLLSATGFGLDLPEGQQPGSQLSRGDMARLVVRFLAHSEGELEALLLSESGQAASSAASSAGTLLRPGEIEVEIDDELQVDIEEDLETEASSSSESSSVDNTGEFEPEAVEVPADTFDPITDTTVQSQFLLLGEVSPVLGSASVFSEVQPIDVDDIIVRLVGEVSSVSSLLIYDHDRRFLGTAYVDSSFPGNRQYILRLKPGELTVPNQESYSFYTRAVVKGYKEGGESGEVVQVETMGVQGDGAWNKRSASDFTSETYLMFQTARSIITSISNPATPNDALIAGSHIRLGSFRFKGDTGDGSADLAVTDLAIRVDQTGGVSVENVQLGADGLSEKIPCTSVPGEITCSSIPAQYGSFEDIPRILTLYGDIFVTSSSQNGSLQLKLNDAGSVNSAGAITWTDGERTFTWVQGDTPVVRSTYFSY